MRLNPKLVALLGSERTALALTISLGFTGGIAAVLFAWLMSQAIHLVFLEGETLQDVSSLVIGMLIAAGARALASWGSEASASRMAVRVKSRVRLQLLEHLFGLGPAYTRGEMGEGDVRTGELANTLTEGVEALDAYFSQYLPQIALAAVIPLTILVFVFPLDPLSGAVLLMTAPLIPIFMILIGSSAQAATRRQWHSLSRMSAYLLDVLQGLTTLKLLGRSKDQVDQIAAVSERLRGKTMDVLKVTFLSALALELVTTISTAVVAVQVGLRLLYGYLDFEGAFFVLLLAPEFYLPLRMLGARFHAGMSGVTAAERIFEILGVVDRRSHLAGEEKPLAGERKFFAQNGKKGQHPDREKPSTDASGRSLASARDDKNYLIGDILFKDVGVRYSDGRTALEGASFEIKAGERTALVGASGAGKSTVASLLLRFIEASHGEVCVGDTPLRDIPVELWREKTAWVSQENYLFNESIEANIRLGRPQASMDEVRKAAELAQAHDFIQALPEKYSTRIGERGTRLSAGQAQRIALARAFLNDAPILILDEPSAHLDPVTELALGQATERLMKGRTTIVIAHRLNTILQSDQIVLLNEGRVEACGTHQELLAQSEMYRELLAQYTQGRNGTEAREQPARLMVVRKPGEAGEAQRLRDRVETSGQETIVAGKENPVKTLSRLLGFLQGYKVRVALSVLLGWATVASGVGLLTTSAYLISRAALRPPIAELQVAIVGVRFFGISRGLLRYLERLVSHDLALRILARLRVWLYQAIEPLAPARLNPYRSGDLLGRMTGDISSLENLYVRAVAPWLVALLVTASSGLFLGSFHIELGVIVVAFMMMGGLGLPFFIRRLSLRPGRQAIRLGGEIKAAMVDGLQGCAELLSFGAGDRYLDAVRDIQGRLSQAQMRLGSINGAQSALLGLLGQAGALAVLSAGIVLVGSGQIDGLYLGVIALAVLTSFEALQPLPQAAQVLEGNLEAGGRLFALADTPPTVKEPESSLDIPERWDLSLRGVGFSYLGEEGIPGGLALADISFELPMGKHMAVVGASGTGKTTLMRLLARFWEPQLGSILLNMRELREYGGDDIRKKLAVVPQNPYLFTATILDNMRIGKPDASMDEIIQVARLAQLHEFIEGLPQGYETWVGEHGLKLSAGERQRLAVARGLLADSPLLILDEASANLDAVNERALLANIREARQGRSLLVITHRLVGMEGFEEILVLEDGCVVERGTHTELLAAGGFYRRMWEAQGGFL